VSCATSAKGDLSMGEKQEKKVNEHRSLNEYMTIDCERIANNIVEFLRQKKIKERKDGICLGISGGIDSATVATLATKAVIDPSMVYSLYLPNRDSQKKFRDNAKKLAEKLHINFEIIDLDSLPKEKAMYEPLIFKLLRISSFLNRLGVSIYKSGHSIPRRRMARRDNYVETGLSGQNHFLTTFKNIASMLFSHFDSRHILRRQILEDYATERNLLLIGAANRTESFVGYFVKDGVDDVPIEVILGLCKNQVVQLATYLGIPTEIVKAAPSPDMLKGVRDEDVIGFSYDKLDKVAYVVEHGLPKEVAFGEGVTPDEFSNIVMLNQSSAWKRESKREFPSFD
jgi:NAD+ synthase